MTRRFFLPLAMLAAGAALLVVAGLAHPATGARTGGMTAGEEKGGVLRVARFDDVDSVDPALAYYSWSWELLYPTCAKLFNNPDRPGEAGARVVPEVVRRYTISRDRRTYTFDLNRTYRFHTGAAVTARSFAAALNRDADPRMRSPATTYMHEIVGADAVVRGDARTISGVRVPARYRLQIRLSRPVGDLPARLTMQFFCPILPSTPVDPRGIDDPPGSGPYYVKERVVNQRIVLERNPYYRGTRPANADRIVYTVGIGPEECLAALEADEVDLCGGALAIPESAHRRLAETYGINRPGGRYVRAPVLSTLAFAFNHDRPAFHGPGQIPLEKAINYALDRPELARASGYLAGRRTDRMLPPALRSVGERIYPITGADPVTARKLWAKARIKPKELVLYAPSTPFGVGAARVFTYNLKQIGIDVEVKLFDLAALAQRAGTRGEPFDVALMPWTADYADPAAYFVPLLHSASLGATGNAGWSYLDDPKVDARINAANRLPPGEARAEAWADLDADLMRNDPPWAPYLVRTHRTLVSSSVGCVFVHPLYRDDLAALCKR